MIIAGSGIPAGKSLDVFVNTTDLFATVLSLAGVEAPNDTTTDSVSLAPYFTNPDQTSRRAFLYADQFITSEGVESGGYAYREGRWKLVRNQAVEELYDLRSDPFERLNVLADGVSASEQVTLESLRERVEKLHETEQ